MKKAQQLPENPYPESVFPDYSEAQMRVIGIMLGINGYTLDRLCGSFGRKVWDNCVAEMLKTAEDEN